VGVSTAGLDKILRFSVMLTLADSVALGGQLECAIDQSLGNFIQIGKHASRTRVVIQSLVQVLAMVDSLNNLANNLRDSVDFKLRRLKVNLVMQSFSNLQN